MRVAAGLLPLAFADLARPMLPFALATDASGGEPDQPGDEEDAGGFGAALAASDEWSVRDEFSKAERPGAYVRLSPGKVDAETWEEAL